MVFVSLLLVLKSGGSVYHYGSCGNIGLRRCWVSFVWWLQLHMECEPQCCNNKINASCYGGGTTIDCCVSASVWIYHWTRTSPHVGHHFPRDGSMRCGWCPATPPTRLNGRSSRSRSSSHFGGGRSGKMVGTSSSGWKQLDRGIL